MDRYPVLAAAEAPAAPALRDRGDTPDRFKWNLGHIFADWGKWQAAYDELDVKIGAFASLQGTLAGGPPHLLAALKLRDEIGQLEYRVGYFATLWHDQDQRDNQTNAKRQQVQILFAKAAQASAWFDPELLTIPLARIQEWMAQNRDLDLYGSPSKTSTASRSTCSTTRVNTCCRWRVASKPR